MSRFNVSLAQRHKVTKDIFKLSVTMMYEPQKPNEMYGYNPNLNDYRDFIDNINSEDWKKVRWYINEYDFLVKDPIINRAFYKYWEIVNEFEIFEDYNSLEEKDLILHCAEAPGGFIQGTNIYLQIDRIVEVTNPIKVKVDEDGWHTVEKKKRKPKNDYRIYTISLHKDLPQYKAYNLPSYNRNIINKHVCVTYGRDNTGDINNWDNIQYIKGIADNNFFLITADGGFDEGTDFNNKEQLHYCLIMSEIYAALYLQKLNGHFILKVFDVFTETSVHLLYLLSLAYEEIYVYKPKTSRPTNSEKYIICKGYHLKTQERDLLTSKLRELKYKLDSSATNNPKYVAFSIFSEIPDAFVEKIKGMNSTLLNKQCIFLQRAVELCNDSSFLAQYDNKLQESIERRKEVFSEWEREYNLNSFV